MNLSDIEVLQSIVHSAKSRMNIDRLERNNSITTGVFLIVGVLLFGLSAFFYDNLYGLISFIFGVISLVIFYFLSNKEITNDFNNMEISDEEISRLSQLSESSKKHISKMIKNKDIITYDSLNYLIFQLKRKERENEKLKLLIGAEE